MNYKIQMNWNIFAVISGEAGIYVPCIAVAHTCVREALPPWVNLCGMHVEDF
jgi:hypothetical protein